MAVQALRRRITRNLKLLQTKNPMKESTRARCVGHKLRAEFDCAAVPRSPKLDTVLIFVESIEADSIEEIHAKLLRLLNKEMIEVGPIPMCVCNLIVWAGGNEQLILSLRIGRSRNSKCMAVEGKTAFQAARDVRISPLPTTPLRKRSQRGQVIADRQLFKKESGERSGWLPDDNPWMNAFLDQCARVTQAARDHGQQRSCKARPDYRDVVAHGQLFSPQCSHTIAAGIDC